MNTRLVALVAAAGAALACAPRLLPGSDIKDSPDTRAIAGQLEAYRQAVEKRDPEAVLALTAPDYFDNAGTQDPADDVDRNGLAMRLEELKKISDLRLSLTLRGVEVAKNGTAHAEVTFDQFYRVATPNGPVARRDTDIHQMTFKKIGGKWLFESGL